MAAIHILHSYSLNYIKETIECLCTDKVKKKNVLSGGMKAFPLVFIFLLICDTDLLLTHQWFTSVIGCPISLEHSDDT